MSLVSVQIHSTQFPENVRRDLLESLRSRQVNHKFHYDSIKQTQKWLELHDACSPARTDPNCAEIYDRCFAAVSSVVKAKQLHLVGLGCGGGQKDCRLLKILKEQGRELFYAPCDVSVAMVLVAHQAAAQVVPPANCHPLVCDLAQVENLSNTIAVHADANRLVTFFGMIPNFEPRHILSQLSALLKPGDLLLLSANLAPGPDYLAGVQRVLPLYENALTHDWLMMFLLDLGVEKSDGKLRFAIEESSEKLKRITASFYFSKARDVVVGEENFRFLAGEKIRVFFSYRHTTETVVNLLNEHGIRILDQWITRSEEEGVFLCRRA